MTHGDPERVRRTWAVASTVPDRFAAAFYHHLFRIDPVSRGLLENDIELQRRKLTETLDHIVAVLNEGAGPDVSAARHVGPGVDELAGHHVRASLIAALSDLLGCDFDAEDRAAWECVFGGDPCAMPAPDGRR